MDTREVWAGARNVWFRNCTARHPADEVDVEHRLQRYISISAIVTDKLHPYLQVAPASKHEALDEVLATAICISKYCKLSRKHGYAVYVISNGDLRLQSSSAMSLVEVANSLASNFQHVPIIDLTNVRSNDLDLRRQLAAEIRDACMRVGFFYVKNHGIPDSVISDTLHNAKAFFALPIETKMEMENRKTSNFKGYSPLLSANNDPKGGGDLQEGFEFGWEDPPCQDKGVTTSTSDGVMAGANVWPDECIIPGFRATVLRYYYAVVALGKALLPIFALALNISEDFFDDKSHSGALMKLLHYPPQIGPVDDRVIGIGAHTDWECFTILWQEPEIQALQVLNSQGQWIDAPPIHGSLVINLGDQFARWTNDIFKSTVHRVINNNGSRRYSIPLFFGTDYDVRLEPISSCVSPERPLKYDVVTAGEYVKSRLEATYGHKSQADGKRY